MIDTAFYKRQLLTWPAARLHHAALQAVWEKHLTVGTCGCILQCNPARMVSTGASTDPKAIAQRPCFLCDEHRPAEQEALPLDGELQLLVNPYPILKEHYTLASVEHRPQRLLPVYHTLLQAVSWFPSDFLLFYNGPHCGASAPDHLHLQAGRSSGIPLVDYLRKQNFQAASSAPQIVELAPLGFRLYVLINDSDGIAFRRLYATLPIPEGEEEPRLNVLAFQGKSGLLSVVIPRSKHRPSCYYATDDRQRIVSPGTLDMCGLIITPRHEDFERITAHEAQAMLCEVGFPPTEIPAL